MEELVQEWEGLCRQLREDMEAQERFMQRLLQRAPGCKTPPLEPASVAAWGQADGAARDGKVLDVTEVLQEPLQEPDNDLTVSESLAPRISKRSWRSKSSNDLADIPGMEKDKSWRGRLYDAVDWWDNLREPERHGQLAKIVCSTAFETVTITMVVINCAFIIHQNNVAIEDDEAATSLPFVVLDGVFAAYFLIELILRMMVHRSYFFVNSEMSWNWLDTAIVSISVWQILEFLFVGSGGMQLTFLRSFRILKLCKVLRLLRMVRVFTDLRVMVTAFLNSCLTLLWSISLLVFTITMFALVLVQVVGDHLRETRESQGSCDAEVCIWDELKRNFGSVQLSMLSLYMAVTGGNDWAYYYDMVSQCSSSAGALFVLYTAFYYYGAFNLVTGMFVDKAVRAAQPDSDKLMFQARLTEQDRTEILQAVLKDVREDSNGLVKLKDLRRVIESDVGELYLELLGLDGSDSKTVFDSLGHVSDSLRVADFVKACLRLREGATSLDLNALQFEMRIIRKNLTLLQTSLSDLRGGIGQQRGGRFDLGVKKV